MLGYGQKLSPCCKGIYFFLKYYLNAIEVAFKKPRNRIRRGVVGEVRGLSSFVRTRGRGVVLPRFSTFRALLPPFGRGLL